ncbi:hypothetical protein PHO31112_04413 [Pandoraea horticolens]|uniref:Uncharacterized protein n=1 Tax=Pandoraea horticolens TaxID=2508298 RepID=A0A5E4YCN1_9BURK|nr:hypothetical protein [Pandoraea horticolens]VVE46075.1 hypothetical protein PHO31112_04413 [Pandoraea horticolens]
MGKFSLIQKNITSSSIYVFFQHADSPSNPAYIVFDSDLGMWSDPVILTTMSLHDQENGVYNSDPRAVYWNNKIYLFGRGPDQHVLAMIFDGTTWSDPVTLGDLSCNAITPIVWNNSLYIFYAGHDIGNGTPLSCSQYDENLNPNTPDGNAGGYWVSKNDCTSYPIAPHSVSRNIPAIWSVFNKNGVGYIAQFDGNNLYDGQGLSQDCNPSFGPSTIPVGDNNQVVAYKGSGANGGLYMLQLIFTDSAEWYVQEPPILIDGINISTAPWGILLDGDGSTTANFAIFYAETAENVDVAPRLKMAIIDCNGTDIDGSGTNDKYTYTLSAIQNIDIPVAPTNCSPFALPIP